MSTNKTKFKVRATLEVEFYSYLTKKLNSRAKKYIKKWIKTILKEHCTYIPIVVDKDSEGCWLDDSTRKVKEIKVK